MLIDPAVVAAPCLRPHSISEINLMRFSLSILPIFAAAATVLAAPKAAQPSLVRADEDLGVWFGEAIAAIFPNHTGWDTSYPEYFNQTLVASFNLPKYNFSTLGSLYGAINGLISANYERFTVEFTSTTVYPSPSDAGGIVVATGLISGYTNGTLGKQAPNGVWTQISVVDGARKFTEWHEISDFQF
ncbi:hypothetical protein FB451DRAFT_753866 [Mycena latifolia]|nr:hypothetical protein FB451DRAFT_753866 [Mycena latifolia]